MGLFSWLSELFTESSPETLVLGAELKCPCGSSHSYLYVETDNIDIDNLPEAHIDDCKAFKNIQPFGTCKLSMGSIAFPCEEFMRLADQWENPEPQEMLSNEKEVITTKSTLICLVSGKEITPVTSGQDQMYAKQLILYKEMEEKYPELLKVLMEPYGSLYLNDGMLEMAFQFIEDQIESHGGELSLISIHDGADPESEVIRVILERLIPDCKTWTCYDFQRVISDSMAGGWEKIDEATQKKILEKQAGKQDPYRYLGVLDYDRLELLKANCKAKEEKIQTNAFDRWVEENREFTTKLKDGLTQTICAALLCSSVVTVTPLEDQFLLPGSTSGGLVPQSGAGGSGLPANIGSGYREYPIIGAIPGPVIGEPALPEGLGGGAQNVRVNDTQDKFNELLNSDYYKNDFGYDCSEIAQDFYDAAGHQGSIYHIEGKNGYINGYEYNYQVEYLYHEVYSDGTYIYDPRYTNVPVPKDEYFKELRKINPDGFEVFEKNGEDDCQ